MFAYLQVFFEFLKTEPNIISNNNDAEYLGVDILPEISN